VDLVTVSCVASGSPGWKGYAVFIGVVLIILATTGVWNPFPKIWSWIDTSDPIAPGVAQWQLSLGGTPQSVTIAGGAVIVEYRTSIEAYGVGAGVKLWKSDADWASVAGGDADAVVVVGRLLTKGYQVLDPRTGAVQRVDSSATGVWTYTNGILDLHCAKGNDCELTAWDPRGIRPLWTVPAPSLGFKLSADNPDLPDTQPLTATRVNSHVAGPTLMPGLIGLPDDGKVRIVDTARGTVVQTVAPGADQRVSVAGGRVLTVTGVARDGTCYYAVAASAPPSSQPVWSREGLNLRTAGNGSSCKQTRDPAGGYDVVLGVDPIGRPELIAAHDGRVLWHGDSDQRVLAVNDATAVIRSADGRSLVGRSFTGGPGWRRPVSVRAQAALTPWAAVITDSKPARATALNFVNGSVLTEAKTDATVFAVGPGAMILFSGRDMAYLPFRAAPAQ
jgi:outer membrane protein assembly factor BamB